MLYILISFFKFFLGNENVERRSNGVCVSEHDRVSKRFFWVISKKIMVEKRIAFFLSLPHYSIIFERYEKKGDMDNCLACQYKLHSHS